MKKACAILVVVALILLVCLLGGMQFMRPSIVGANPVVIAQPTWPDAQTEALARQACYDCHSNETAWPWFTRVAPMSWLVANDVAEARARLNFSEWGSRPMEIRELGEAVLEGEMPPGSYLLMHVSARLTASERQALAAGLQSLR
jgi:hypothetical protein